MANKKKETSEYTPSKYQTAIFDYIKNGQGHLVVEAAAGSGKTWTLIKSIGLIPSSKKILLSAFNNDIVKELKKKVGALSNVDTRTLHSLGLMFINRNYKDKETAIEPFKYDAWIRKNAAEISQMNIKRLKYKEYLRYLENVKKYVDFGRYYLCQTIKDLDFIDDRYDIDPIGDEKDVAIAALEWGKEELDIIDYVDMIWLPHALYMKPLGLQYDYIMIDECQDMNKAERELVLKCFKMGTRLISFGDSNQTIYSFSGSDPESFETLKAIPNTISLPLSISYRCADSIVDFAKKIVPSIERNDDGREGSIIKEASLEDVKDGDMILCRNNGPLIQVYSSFLKMGKKSFIMGKEIGSNLKTTIRKYRQKELNVSCDKDGLFVRLYDDLFCSRNDLIRRSGIDAATAIYSQQIQNKLDIIKVLEILSSDINTTDELLEKIDNIFSKKNKNEGIALSTIHKAKGLEANNVFIACSSLMPAKSAKLKWEINQEHNLMYVAYTRAKNKLGFLDEKDFEQFDLSNQKNMKELEKIETKVNLILKKSTKVKVTASEAHKIVSSATKITKEDIKKPKAKKKKVNKFAAMLNKR